MDYVTNYEYLYSEVDTCVNLFSLDEFWDELDTEFPEGCTIYPISMNSEFIGEDKNLFILQKDNETLICCTKIYSYEEEDYWEISNIKNLRYEENDSLDMKNLELSFEKEVFEHFQKSLGDIKHKRMKQITREF